MKTWMATKRLKPKVHMPSMRGGGQKSDGAHWTIAATATTYAGQFQRETQSNRARAAPPANMALKPREAVLAAHLSRNVEATYVMKPYPSLPLRPRRRPFGL